MKCMRDSRSERLNMWLEAAFWCCFYPANLYLFTQFQPKHADSRIKVLSTIFSCALLAWRLNFAFTLTGNWRLLLLWLAAMLPFLVNFTFEPLEPLWWRDFIVSPSIEELYYRILLPLIMDNFTLLTLAFSLTHGHSLLFDRSARRDEVISNCIVSLAFALVANLIRVKSNLPQTSLYLWLSLSILHGTANYVGFPAKRPLFIIASLLCLVLL